MPYKKEKVWAFYINYRDGRNAIEGPERKRQYDAFKDLGVEMSTLPDLPVIRCCGVWYYERPKETK